MLKKETDYWPFGKDKVDMHLLLMITRPKIGTLSRLLILETLKESGLMFISVIVQSPIKLLDTSNSQAKNHNQ